MKYTSLSNDCLRFSALNLHMASLRLVSPYLAGTEETILTSQKLPLMNMLMEVEKVLI